MYIWIGSVFLRVGYKNFQNLKTAVQLPFLAESLAGRVGILELDPLTPAETELPVNRHWLEGGFPEALRGDFRIWWDPYLESVLQRDLAAYRFRPDAFFLRGLLTMIASQQGGLINASSLGKALGVSHNAIRHALDLLEGKIFHCSSVNYL